MAKKILTILVLLLILGGIAWGIYDMMTPTPVVGNTTAVIN